jgi:hypothetical protein
MVSVIMHLLFSLREVFRQAKSVMLGKRHFHGYYKNGYVNSVKRGFWLYNGSPVRKNSKSTKGRIM